MTKKLFISTITFFFIITFTAMAFAEEPAGNKRKGKYTYKKVYKSCMERGEVESERPIINPSDKTMSQWQRVFETKDFSEFKCAEDWKNLNEEELLDIYSYLYTGAADSPTPAKCK
ncbi:conserved exported hypothetical protein [Desulfamplus magnetovallimortis]|uniref:Cytochrome c family protein n=1 Tax=Desulfamplus magnetovallimortis TaxID=1246637 RepID=A0A1W1H695_9BACT|nr:cytochrome c family protein [Desulfamplus magnetovallimortis]SLM27956.1 conserved exported hypothetical protein [Desulfamplus magnetovallimortis]